MKKMIVKASENVLIGQQDIQVSMGEKVSLPEKTAGVTLRFQGFLKDVGGNDLHIFWNLHPKLFNNNVFLRGVSQVADGWTVVLDCSLLNQKLNIPKDTPILVGHIYEPASLHRIGFDITPSGHRIL